MDGFWYRDVLQWDVTPQLATQLRLNGQHCKLPSRFIYLEKFVHSLLWWLPPQVYAADHPEWYWPRGKPQTVCLSNAAAVDMISRRVMSALDAQEQSRLVSVSQMDGHVKCECDACMSVSAEEGSYAGVMLRAVNTIAQYVGRRFPCALIETLAYVYTQTPPRAARPEDNVIIRFCPNSQPLNRAFTHTEQYVQTQHDLRAWSKIARHLHIWEYCTNFGSYFLPSPVQRQVAENVTFAESMGVTGYFAQGDAMSKIGFAPLLTFVYAALMRNPLTDYDQLVVEWLEPNVGTHAAPHVKAYLALLDGCRSASQEAVSLRRINTSHAWFPLEAMNEAAEHWDAATSVPRTASQAATLQSLRLTYDFAWLANHKQFANRSADATYRGPSNVSEACDEWLAKATSLGVGSSDEKGTSAAACISELKDSMK